MRNSTGNLSSSTWPHAYLRYHASPRCIAFDQKQKDGWAILLKAIKIEMPLAVIKNARSQVPYLSEKFMNSFPPSYNYSILLPFEIFTGTK